MLITKPEGSTIAGLRSGAKEDLVSSIRELKTIVERLEGQIFVKDNTE